MGIFDALLGRSDADADQRPAAGGPSPPIDGPAAAGGSSPAADGRASLERRRDELVAQVAELHWDLGGLAYEMAIRDHFRLDVLVRRAAELQERDAELGELERVLSLREHAGAGTCPDCGAVHARGALYCWQCGRTLMERIPSAAANGSANSAGEGHAEPHAVPPLPRFASSGVDGEASPQALTSSGLAAGDAQAPPAVTLPPRPTAD